MWITRVEHVFKKIYLTRPRSSGDTIHILLAPSSARNSATRSDPVNGTGQARHHRLGQTGGMRHRGRLGGSSPGHVTAIGTEGSHWQGYFICFPQTPHLAQAKVPDQSFSLPELPISLLFSTTRLSSTGEKLGRSCGEIGGRARMARGRALGLHSPNSRSPSLFRRGLVLTPATTE